MKTVKLVPVLAVLCGVLGALAADQPPPARPDPPAAKVNLLSVSDWGFSTLPEKKNPDQQLVARAMADYVRRSGLRFDAVLVTGDNFKVKLDGPDDPKFNDGFEDMYDPAILDMPFYLVLGGHDHEYKAASAQSAYAKRHPQSRWKMPARWYRIDFPADRPFLTVLMLDSNRGSMSSQDWKTQLKWMEQELSRPPDSAWTMCCAHDPLFSNGMHGDSKTMQEQFGPLLRKHNVDFYLSGHDHVLQHLQMQDWTTTFIINGAGGENTKRPFNMKRPPFLQATHGFAHFQFSPELAKVSFIDSSGKLLHAFERSRQGAVHIVKTTTSDKPVPP